MEKIALEEHFRVPNMPEYSDSGGYFSDQTAAERLDDLLADFDDLRLQAMGEANVTKAILSHTMPGLGATTDKKKAVAQQSSISSFLRPSSFFGVARKAPILVVTPTRIPKTWPKIWQTCSSAFLQNPENGYRLPRQMRVEGG